jgi:hypothetical protein
VGVLEDGVEPLTQPVVGDQFQRAGEAVLGGGQLGSLAKGLGYDYVVLDEPQAVVDGEPDERTGLRRLYVALTRAVSGLIVAHALPLPPQLGQVSPPPGSKEAGAAPRAVPRLRPVR